MISKHLTVYAIESSRTYLGSHVVLNASGQMAKHRVHRVPGLLPSDAEKLLQSARHGRENGLRRFMRVHGNGRTRVLTLAQPTNVSERVFGGDDQTRFPLSHATFVLELLVESIVMSTSVGSVKKTLIDKNAHFT